MSDLTRETIHFSDRQQALALQVSQQTPAQAIIAALELARPRALLVLNGGTARLESELETQLAQLLQDGLARVVAEERVTVVTGGTNAGIFALFGAGRAVLADAAPCIGVAVAGLVTWPGHPDGEAALEPHHSHFVLVEGERWGDETATMYDLVAALAQDCPSLAVFAGGGEIVQQEMLANMRQGRPMLLLGGSGRSTDAVLDVRDGAQTDDPEIRAVAASAQIISFALDQGPAALRELIRSLLGDR